MNGTNIVAGFEEVGRKAVSQRVTTGRFGKSRCIDGFVDCFLDAVFVDVVATELAAFQSRLFWKFTTFERLAGTRGLGAKRQPYRRYHQSPCRLG